MMHTPTASTIDVAGLQQALSERLKKVDEGTILGAQLGTHLNEILAPSSYKSWLPNGSQNLRTFAEQFLGDIVTPTTERRGSDYLFQINGSSQEIIPSFGGALWKAFCAVQPKQVIHFEPAGSTLYLIAVGADAAIEDPTILPVSKVEHKAICQEFATSLKFEDIDSQNLVDIANDYENRSYATWVTALKSETGLFGRWGIFRIARIKALFADRLQPLTNDPAVCARLESEFEADHRQLGMSGLSTKPPLAPAAAQMTIPRASDYGTRQVLAKALEMLDDTQLAKILVPLDVVAALLAQRKQ
jgi:hypothetical protein